MRNINISTGGVNKLLKRVNLIKALGPDMVPTQIFKDNVDIIAPVMRDLFQQTLKEGSYRVLDQSTYNINIQERREVRTIKL